MRYEGTVYRPPSEARSLIIQVTIGCSHNKCTFCSMYKDKKFRIRPIEDIIEDLNMARKHYPVVRRIFLADGDALVLKTSDLIRILNYIDKTFPECERVSIYATPSDILNKTVEELKALKYNGINMMYMGIESGNDKILSYINKNVNSEEIKEAGRKVKAAGIKLSTTLISGLGGKDNLEGHAIDSAKLINAINPDYIGLLTLMLEENTPLYNDYKNNTFSLLTPREIMLETKMFIENLEVKDSVFRSNHASNYISLSGTLSEDKERLIKEINDAIDDNKFKDEETRRL